MRCDNALMIIDIDTSLQPVDYRYTRDLASVLDATKRAEERNGESTPDSTERLVRHSLPDGNGCQYHSNYMTYLISNWSKHRSIVLNPDVVWFAVLHEIAQGIVQNPEPHRSLFTRQPDKITLMMKVDRADAVLPIDAVINELRALVPVDIDLFLPKFTTTTYMARMSHLANFAEACTPYYRYMTFMCGFPRIRIDGTIDDYDLTVGRAVAIYNELDRIDSPLAPWIAQIALPWLSNIADGVHRRDASFFSRMIATERCGSGGEIHVNGWWTRLFRDQPDDPKPENFPTQIARVPWENVETKRRFSLNCGVFASEAEEEFWNPLFGFVQNEIFGDQ